MRKASVMVAACATLLWAELQTILQDFPCTGPGGGGTCVCTGPCVESSLNDSNTQSYYYWSATTHAYGPIAAWYVDFFNGRVDYNTKPSDGYVRAVRGGLRSLNTRLREWRYSRRSVNPANCTSGV